jgi:hypothetical protein
MPAYTRRDRTEIGLEGPIPSALPTGRYCSGWSVMIRARVWADGNELLARARRWVPAYLLTI